MGQTGALAIRRLTENLSASAARRTPKARAGALERCHLSADNESNTSVGCLLLNQISGLLAPSFSGRKNPAAMSFAFPCGQQSY